jgi:hypothetical protein
MPEPENNPWISVPLAARFYIFKHVETVRRMCISGTFKSARKVGTGQKAHWQILRREVIQHCGKTANQQL